MRWQWGWSVLACMVVVPAGTSLHAQGPVTIRAGSHALRPQTLSFGTDTVDDYVVTDGTRQLTGTTVRTIAVRREPGEPTYEISSLSWGTQGDTTGTTLVVRAADLSLVFHRVRAQHDSAAVTATRTHLTSWAALPNQPVLLLDVSLEHPVFGLEGQVPWLLPLLPFAPGYTAAIPHFSEWTGREKWDTVAVLGEETLLVGTRTYHCWKVDAGRLGPPGYRVTRWIDKRSRQIIQSALRGPSAGPEYWSYLRP
jgi:hypothetical protein